MLSVEDLEVSYGAIRALRGVSLEVCEGEIVTIVGANGAGKTSLLNTIAGLVKPSKGEMRFEGKPVPRQPHEAVRSGIVLVPEGRRVFGNLTTRENLLMGAYLRSDRSGIEADLQRVYRIFPRLQERLWQPGSTLSGGEQQMLAIARGLMSKPRLLLLDEPSLGLAPILVQEIFRQLHQVNREGVTMLLVEQNARQALLLAHRAYVFQTGEVMRSGGARELLKDPFVQEAYLGRRRQVGAT